MNVILDVVVLTIAAITFKWTRVSVLSCSAYASVLILNSYGFWRSRVCIAEVFLRVGPDRFIRACELMYKGKWWEMELVYGSIVVLNICSYLRMFRLL
jgi:hypothetical protein